MDDKMNIDGLQKLFTKQKVVSNTDILMFYRQKEPLILKSSVNWRIYELTQKGIIHRIAKGKYCIGRSRPFTPKLSVRALTVGRHVAKYFPYINCSVWELAVVNNFSQHLINYNVIFVDVERDVIDSVYNSLKDMKYKVFCINDMRNDLSDYVGYICIRSLTTESPFLNEKKIRTSSLEKILVDLSCDKEFVSFQSNEIYHIYQTAFDTYTINESSLLRYASRKEKKEKILTILETIKRQ